MVLKRPILTSAVAYGPTTGQALAAGAPGVTYTSWRFTATAPDGTKIIVDSLIPDARWGTTAATALKPSTTCEHAELGSLHAGGVGCAAAPHAVRAPVPGPREPREGPPSTSSSPAPCCCARRADIVSVVGIQADGQAVAAENTLPMTTPAAG